MALVPDAERNDAWMRHALVEARRAVEHDDVPVGALVVPLDAPADGPFLALAHNARERDHDPTAHAEVLALRAAARARGTWRLDDCALVVTLEPCTMCAGAALHARIGAVVFGAYDLRFGALGSRYHFLADPRLNHQAPVAGGVRADEASDLLQSFFADRR
jgi:tRNA(adenine34) deaminase